MRRLLCKILSGSSFKTFRTVCRFHFGQISTARAVMYTKKHSKVSASIAAFTEETLVRGELSDNFCYYQENHDNVSTLNPICTAPRSESIPTVVYFYHRWGAAHTRKLVNICHQFLQYFILY